MFVWILGSASTVSIPGLGLGPARRAAENGSVGGGATAASWTGPGEAAWVGLGSAGGGRGVQGPGRGRVWASYWTVSVWTPCVAPPPTSPPSALSLRLLLQPHSCPPSPLLFKSMQHSCPPSPSLFRSIFSSQLAPSAPTNIVFSRNTRRDSIGSAATADHAANVLDKALLCREKYV